MGFESGSVSFRLFHVPGGLPAGSLEKFAAHAAPGIEHLGREPVSGWVTGRHLLDRNITEDTAVVAGYLRLTLLKAERKIPEALLRAHCRMEELAQMAAENAPFLRAPARAAIRKAVVERLLPKMPPTLTGIPIVFDNNERLLYVGATAQKQVEALALAFGQTTGRKLVPVTPAAAALERKRLNVRDLQPASYSPEFEDGQASESLGQDFLTWLWFHSETRGGTVTLEDGGEFAVALEGPLLFVLEGEGAHEAILRRGAPLVSAEAKTALLAGKKLRAARLLLVRGDEGWRGALDAEEFVFRGVALPKGEKLDPVSRFQERMGALDLFRRAVLGYFDLFLDERADGARWRETLKAIHRWVSGRTTRR
jgi:hypothetical protein